MYYFQSSLSHPVEGNEFSYLTFTAVYTELLLKLLNHWIKDGQCSNIMATASEMGKHERQYNSNHIARHSSSSSPPPHSPPPIWYGSLLAFPLV